MDNQKEHHQPATAAPNAVAIEGWQSPKHKKPAKVIQTNTSLAQPGKFNVLRDLDGNSDASLEELEKTHHIIKEQIANSKPSTSSGTISHRPEASSSPLSL